MKVEVSAVARGPIDAVWRWWTDYGQEGEVRPVSHGFGPSERRIVERREDRLVMEERMPLPLGQALPLVRHVVEIHADKLQLVERGEKPRFSSTWTFAPAADGGTRITRVTDFELPGRIPAPEGIVRRALEHDLRHHVREFEREHPAP